MHSNFRPSQVADIVGQVPPSSQAASTVTSGWIDAAQFEMLMGIVQGGTLGASATLDAKFQQATDNAGTGVKDVSVTAMTQNIKATDDNKANIINLLNRDLDFANGFRYVRLSVTVGTAASLTAALVLGMNERYGPANLQNSSTIVKSVTN